MKKLLCILTAFVMMLGCCAVVSADTPATTVEVSTSDLFVEVTVKTTQAADRLTLKVVNTQNNTALYATQKTTPDSVEEGVKSYEFSFYAKDGTASGYYRAIAGGFGSTAQSEDFALITNADKKDFYDTLDTKSAEDIQLFFSTRELFLPQPYADYAQIDGSVLTLINAEIAAMNLAVETDYSNLSAVDNAFCEFYSKSVLLGNVIQEEDVDEWNLYIKDLIDDFGFYDEYYKKLQPADVYKYFTIEKSATIDVDVIKTAFDESVILAVAEKFNANILRDVVASYSLRNTVTMNLTDYNSLSYDSKLTACENVKAETPATFEDFKRLLAEKSQSLKGTGGNQGTGLGGGGGAGGSGLGGGLSGGLSGGGNISINTDREETPATPVVSEKVTFSDISHVGWAQEAIAYLASEGVIDGKSYGKFCPDDNITREEFVKIISEAFGYTTDKATAEFSDVPDSKWSYIYIASAHAAGIISGVGDGMFGAHDNITRQDMAVILSRVLSLADVSASGGAVFSDEKAISPYAKDAVDMLSALGIVNGMGDGTFAPKGYVTRAQAAKAIYNTLMTVVE